MKRILQFSIFIFQLAISLRAAAQTTQPSYSQQLASLGNSVDLMLKARDAQIASLNQQLATRAPAIINPQLPSEIGPVLAAAKPGQVLHLADNTAYICTTTPVITAANVKILGGAGTSLRIAARPGASSGIAVQAAGFEAGNLAITAPPGTICFRVWSPDFYLHESTIADGCEVGVQSESTAARLRITGCRIGVTGGCGIFLTSDDAQIVDTTCAGSIGEHPMRVTSGVIADGKGGLIPHRPSNCRLIRCVFINHNDGKECFTARELDGLLGADCTFDGFISGGQENGTDDPNWHVRDIVLTHCNFPWPRKGGALMQFDHDCDVFLDSVTAPGSATDAIATISRRGVITTRDCTLTGTPASAGQSFKPFAAAFDAARVEALTRYAPPSATRPILTTQPTGSTSN